MFEVLGADVAALQEELVLFEVLFEVLFGCCLRFC